jgi:hypothetical protein
MKQASFLIGDKKVDNLSNILANDLKDNINNDLINDKKNITSNKPIKLVENIYYFTSSIPNSKNM